jgi:3-phosphoshikimate 1-carboxyvinyltransferase
VHSHDDHRIAMAFTMAALRASGEIRIDDCDNVNTSFPGFAELATSCGVSIQVINE